MKSGTVKDAATQEAVRKFLAGFASFVAHAGALRAV